MRKNHSPLHVFLRTGNRISFSISNAFIDALLSERVIPRLSIYLSTYSHLGILFEMTCMQARGDDNMHVRFFFFAYCFSLSLRPFFKLTYLIFFLFFFPFDVDELNFDF